MIRRTLCSRKALKSALCIVSRSRQCCGDSVVGVPCLSGWLRQTAVWRQQAVVESLDARLGRLQKKLASEKALNKLLDESDYEDLIETLATKEALKIKNDQELTEEERAQVAARMTENDNSRSLLEAKRLRRSTKIDKLKGEIEAVKREVEQASYASWTLSDFLKFGVKCGALSVGSAEWQAYCMLLPVDVRKYLQTAKHPLPATSPHDAVRSGDKQNKWNEWPWTFIKTDDDYRLWMGNVAGSLIKKCTLEELTKRIAHHKEALEPSNAAPLDAVSKTLGDSLKVLAAATQPNPVLPDESHFCRSRHLVFTMDVKLGEICLMQFANKTICPNYSIICSDTGPVRRALKFLPADLRLHNDEELRKTIPIEQLRLVSGTSGSGKTVAALMSAGREGIVMYTVADYYTNCEHEHGNRAERDTAVTKAVVATVERLVTGGNITKRFAGKVVVVIDEAGKRPVMVRSLCRVHRDVCALLAVTLLVDVANISVLVCGTGVERPDGALGSMPSIYHLTNMSSWENESNFFEKHFLGLVGGVGGCPRLAAILRNPDAGASPTAGIAVLQRHSVVERCRRMLQNRRMAAIFAVNISACRSDIQGRHDRMDAVDESISWPLQLPSLIQRMLWGFREVNALQAYSTSQIKSMYSAALAMCLGGPYQYKELHNTGPSMNVLFATTGMLQDNRVLKDDKSTLVASEPSGEVENGEKPLHYGLRGDRDSMERHGMRCFTMTSAVVEAGLCGFSDIMCAAPRTASGLEHTLAKIAFLWQQALVSGVPINLELPGTVAGDVTLDDDYKCAFEFLKLLDWVGRLGGCDGAVQLVAHIELTDAVTSVPAAWLAAHQDANVAVGSVVRAVIVNGPNASFGDVLVVVGRKGEAQPRRCLILQAKQRLGSANPLCRYEAAHEHYKNGVVDATTIAGHAFASAKKRYKISSKLDVLPTGEAALYARRLFLAGATHGIELRTPVKDSRLAAMGDNELELPWDNLCRKALSVGDVPQPNHDKYNTDENISWRYVPNVEPFEEAVVEAKLSYADSVKNGYGGASTTCEIEKSRRLEFGTTPVKVACAVQSVVLCCADASVKCSYTHHVNWHTIVLNERALRIALRPVAPFVQCSSPRRMTDQSHSSALFDGSKWTISAHQAHQDNQARQASFY